MIRTPNRGNLRARGATGFDGLDEEIAACPGPRFLVKPLGKIQLPTLNWHWLRKLS